MDTEGERLPEPAKPSAEPENKFEAQPRSTADYNKYTPGPNSKPPSQWKRWAIWAGIIIAVLAALLIGYKLLNKKPAATTVQSQTNTAQTSQSQPTITVTTKNYASQNFALSFDYPQNWTVTDGGGGIMTVKSPSISLKDGSGQSFNGQIILNFRNKTQKLTEFDAGSATAERDSIKIAYTKPTQTQRADTYISYLRYAKTTSGLNGVYITGNSGYKLAQAIPAADISKVDPVINYSFAKCADSTCVSVTASAISAATWDALATQLEQILKSLVIT